MAPVNPHARKPLPVTLERHELSAMFGDMPEDERLEMQEDIKANGLREPIVLLDGKILDGWHRYLCLCALGRPLNKYNSYEFDPVEDKCDATTYVHSRNLFRRQLTADERVRIVAMQMGYESPGRGGKQSARKGPTMEAVAAAAKVSKATAVRALKKASSPSDEAGEPQTKAPTLEALEKKRDRLAQQLAEVEEQIAALKKPGRRVRSS